MATQRGRVEASSGARGFLHALVSTCPWTSSSLLLAVLPQSPSHWVTQRVYGPGVSTDDPRLPPPMLRSTLPTVCLPLALLSRSLPTSRRPFATVA